MWFNSRMKYHPLNFLPAKRNNRCLMGVGSPQLVNLAAVKVSMARIKPACYGLGHIPFDERILEVIRHRGIKPILVIRDPRDVAISSVHHALRRERHFLHETLSRLPTRKKQIEAVIAGGVTERGVRFSGIAEQIDLIEGWFDQSDVLVVRFEDLIGEKGDGDPERQTATIMEIGEFIGIPISRSQSSGIGEAMFGQGQNFRRGKMGAWEEEFDDELRAIVLASMGTKLGRLGYR